MRISDWSSDVCSSDLYGKDFWSRVVNFEALCEEGVISPRDLDIFTIVETAEEGWDVVRNFYRDRHEDRANPTAGEDPQPPLERQGFAEDRKSTRLNSSH